MRSNFPKYLLIGVCFTCAFLFADVNSGTTSETLDAAIKNVNAGPDFTL